jgi:steroid 5-alpha reductase family enzyme
MGLDIRIPLGFVFVILGAIMAIYGVYTWGSSIYASSSGLNINFIWGLVMLLFGTVMLLLARHTKSKG